MKNLRVQKSTLERNYKSLIFCKLQKHGMHSTISREKIGLHSMFLYDIAKLCMKKL